MALKKAIVTPIQIVREPLKIGCIYQKRRGGILPRGIFLAG
jgi:hypothetical protein